MSWPVALLLAGCTAAPSTALQLATERGAPRWTGRFFAASSPFNSPVSAAEVDPGLTQAVRRDLGAGLVANLVAYGIPVHVVDRSEAASGHDVQVVCDADEGWGACPLEGATVHLPAGAGPNSGSDATLVLLDADTGVTEEFWRVGGVQDGVLSVGWGDRSRLDGDGWDSTATGSGASRLAGVVRVAEIRRGRIDHALALQSSTACSGTWVPPATKTDGTSTAVDCLPEGSRLRLDPALDLDALGLSGAERIVAQALQDHGGFLVDRGGAPLSMSFELAPDADPGTGRPGAVYERSGLGSDYQALGGFPVTSLQVLRPPEVSS